MADSSTLKATADGARSTALPLKPVVESLAMPPPTLAFRAATLADAPVLGAMNRELILAERNRNAMTVPQLVERMATRLAPGHPEHYAAVLFEAAGQPIGYVLYRRLPDYVYIQQLFVAESHRRQGVARAALAWLQTNPWRGVTRFQLDVLESNTAAAKFWQTVGFIPYCTTMEATDVNWQ